MNWEPENANPVVGSFLPWLKWALTQTSGPVLELGGGYFSSPVVHEAFKFGRSAVTYEYDPVWAHVLSERFTQPITPDFELVADLEWDVVLVDCEGWNRLAFVEALRPRTKVFVIHDSQDPWVPDTVLDSFQFRADRELDPRTTLVSDVLDIRGAP